MRSHGGGIRPLAAAPEHPLRVRENMHQEQKARIADAAVSLLKSRQTVVLGTGSTCVEVARVIRNRGFERLNVITYALNVAMQLADLPGIDLMMIGGILRQVSSALVGPQAEQMIQALHADHCFLPAVGLDLQVGLTTLDIMEAQLNRVMIKNSGETTVVADSSKFGVRSLAVVTSLQSIHRLITDLGAPPAEVAKLQSSGVEVVLV